MKIRERVWIGASAGPGVEGIAAVLKLRLGNCVLCNLPNDLSEALAMARFCRENGLLLFFAEVVFRGGKDLWRPDGRRRPREACLSREEMAAVFREAGDLFGGRMAIGEAGGMLYWPHPYLRRPGSPEYSGSYPSLPPCADVREARAAYMEYLREALAFERGSVGPGPLMNVESALVFKYHAESGIDVLCHEMLPGDPHRMQAAVRGAARAYGKPWGTHVAMGWYGGVTVDALWLRRWKTSLYFSYLTGADFIYPESGHLGLTDHQTRKRHDAQSPPMREARRILREAYRFSLVHTRPAGGPKVRLGIVSGHGDGAPGLWNPHAWGQVHRKKWLAGPPERGWDLLDTLHRRADWSRATVQGDWDESGQPPYGQFDIVPMEADADGLRRYTCLVFVGWNTMTEEAYEKLKTFVAAGGRLLMFLPQLREDADRGSPPRLFRNGDFRDLFGLRVTGRERRRVQGIKFIDPSSLPAYRFPVSGVVCDPRFLGCTTRARVERTTARVLAGHDMQMRKTSRDRIASRPVLIENRLGKGVAMLVTLFEYPADEALVDLAVELLRVVSAGEQGEVHVIGSDRVRYAVYALPGGADLLYLLNTDPDAEASVRIAMGRRRGGSIRLPANEMRLAYRFKDVLVVTGDPCVELDTWDPGAETVRLSLFLAASQLLHLQNLGTDPVRVQVNEQVCAVGPGETSCLDVPRRAAPGNRAFDEDFVAEPPLPAALDPRTPY